MLSWFGTSKESKQSAETLEYPKVWHRRSGVRYVKANDLLRSEAAQRELDQVDEALDALAETKDQEE